MIDVELGARRIVNNLREHDFRNRDADPTDFQFGMDPGLRFKVGTVRGEVTITVWKWAKQVEVIRVLSDAQVVEAKHRIDALIHEFRESRRV
jgi:hypothetical protein